jgi:hypothetical protein
MNKSFRSQLKRHYLGTDRFHVVWQVLQTPNVAPRRAGSRHHSDNAKRAYGVAPGKTYGRFAFRAFSKHCRPYGQRESERRLAQIQRGQLKAENGLVA